MHSSHVRMRIRFANILVIGLVAGCAVRNSNLGSHKEPIETYVSVFEQYHGERRALSLTELNNTLRVVLENPSPENIEHLNHVYAALDITRITNFFAEGVIAPSVQECLQKARCGTPLKSNMQRWVLVSFKPIRICRGTDAPRARLYYQGTSVNGKTELGIVDFLKVKDAWKISFESFGVKEDAERNMPFQAACEDARA